MDKQKILQEFIEKFGISSLVEEYCNEKSCNVYGVVLTWKQMKNYIENEDIVCLHEIVVDLKNNQKFDNSRINL